MTLHLAPSVRSEPCLGYQAPLHEDLADFGICAECGWLDHEHDVDGWAQVLPLRRPTATVRQAS